MTVNGWVRQYAITMPNGELYWKPGKAEPVEDFSVSSPMRDMFGLAGMFGGSFFPTPETETNGEREVVLFRTRKDAETKLAELRREAEKFGVTAWGGTVSERLCTPFTSADPAVQFSNTVIAWLQQQVGES